MRINEFEPLKKKNFAPKAVARLWGGHNGRKIPDDIKPLWSKHVKTAANGKQFINQYPDKWYYDIFYKHPDITDFDSFFNKLKPYFEVQRIQSLT
jgi:hypothetical protein